MSGPNHPAIVVVAWNRPQSLIRLLTSLKQAHFPADTPLHISIDHFEYDDVRNLAQSFEWPHGIKVVQIHPERLGLRKHMLHCGGLTTQYGSIVLLEDDLMVSPEMYAYATAALDFFAGDQDIAGISLYNYGVAECCHQPFTPWLDAHDNWFLQLPSSWGAAFSAAQWKGFMDWQEHHLAKDTPPLPAYMRHWSVESWKKLFAAYMLATDTYFVYPRFSLTTNFEDYGAHANTRGLFQVPLLMEKRQWKFSKRAASLAVYDAHFEPLAQNLVKICPALSSYDFAVDCYGQKDKTFIHQPWMLTRKQGGEAKLSFAATAIPTELNLHFQIPGDQLRLVPSDAAMTPIDPLDLEFNYYTGVAKTAALHLPDRRMPSITVILHFWKDGNAHPWALESVLDQQYPGKEVLVVVEPGKMPKEVWAAYRQGKIQMVESSGHYFEGIQKAVTASSSQLIQIISDDFDLSTHVLERIAKIFHQFPGLDWLSGLPLDETGLKSSLLMAPYRWDKERFHAATDPQIAQFLPSSLQVFRRALWMKAPSKATTLEYQFRQMGFIALPQISTLEMGDWKTPPTRTEKSTWGSGKVNSTRKYYHRHIPILWKWHRRLSNYRPVLRYDADHDTWFEMDY